MTCLICKHGKAKRSGTYTHNSRRIQRYRCKDCSRTFSETRLEAVEGHYIDKAKTAKAFALMLEGMSVRAISRITGLHRDTILSLMVATGRNCRAIFNKRVRNLRTRFVQADELWTFVHTKEPRLTAKSLKTWGDCYVWIALDSETKMILSYLVGKRDAASAHAFMRDLSKRIRGRFQLTTDGFRAYNPAIEEYFGADVDYGQIVKHYRGATGESPDWYRASQVMAVSKSTVSGRPQGRRISTSHVERSNLTIRMHLRRFTRLTNGFSKKRTNLAAAVSLFVVWYNFCRVHSTLRVTPAMQAGLTNYIWTIGELL